ncbi:hypothetical protein POX_d05370 [Penicillium oxalicum]|uniref:hypothetical protein n=1 Tax=Penicillium oxalicum TaxID=69781 RepID=UPI0020B7919D|nr:hypothetical protein POX_d05370 [Penicillium oxalicum]KAI2789871.1 hypothetical protein POX_d05370 [Penicillium oxalicum]
MADGTQMGKYLYIDNQPFGPSAKYYDHHNKKKGESSSNGFQYCSSFEASLTDSLKSTFLRPVQD